jgi:hypothetical protein
MFRSPASELFTIDQKSAAKTCNMKEWTKTVYEI